MNGENPFIVIAVDPHSANTVVAYDMTTGKREIAKCSPEDRFDFGTGARLALERMFPTKEPCKFKVGDIVIGNEKAKRYSITCPGWVGRVVGFVSFSDGKTIIKVVSIINKDSGFDVDPDAFDLATNCKH